MTGETKQEILPPEKRATPYRYRYDGWTPARQAAFLQVLREGGCIQAACNHIGLSRTSLARVRKRQPSFGDAVELILAYRAPALERAACERAIHGWDEPVYYGGKLVGHRRRYSDALLRLLILRADTANARVAKHPLAQFAKREETDKAILAKLDTLEAARKRGERRNAIAFADDMRVRGLAP